MHAHAQERIFAQIKAFNADLRVPRGCLESLSSFPRSIQVYDCTHVRRRLFFRLSKLLAPIWGYLWGFSSRWARFRGLLKYTPARACAGTDFPVNQCFYAELVSEVFLSLRMHAHAQGMIFAQIKAFNTDLRVPRRCLGSLSSFPRSIQVYDCTCMLISRFSC